MGFGMPRGLVCVGCCVPRVSLLGCRAGGCGAARHHLREQLGGVSRETLPLPWGLTSSQEGVRIPSTLQIQPSHLAVLGLWELPSAE